MGHHDLANGNRAQEVLVGCEPRRHPDAVARYRQRQLHVGAKSDPGEAYLLAEIVGRNGRYIALPLEYYRPPWLFLALIWQLTA